MQIIGTIKTWNLDRAFGWIRVQSGKDYFLHIQNWEDSTPPSVGMKVQFEVAPGHRGYKEQAVAVKQLTAQVVGSDALVGGNHAAD